MWSILKNVPYTLEMSIYSGVLGRNVMYMSVWFIWYDVWLNSSASLLGFYLDDLFVIKNLIWVAFLQFKSEICNKEFMIWATVSSWSCFCWLHRASPSSTAKSKSIWFRYWPSGDVHLLSCHLYCWKRMFAMTSVFSWQNFVSLCLASFCTLKPNLPIIPGISTSYFCIIVLYDENLFFFFFWC